MQSLYWWVMKLAANVRTGFFAYSLAALAKLTVSSPLHGWTYTIQCTFQNQHIILWNALRSLHYNWLLFWKKPAQLSDRDGKQMPQIRKMHVCENREIQPTLQWIASRSSHTCCAGCNWLTRLALLRGTWFWRSKSCHSHLQWQKRWSSLGYALPSFPSQ